MFEGPGVLRGADKLANSQRRGRVSLGSMISSTKNASAVRNGDLTLFNRSVISLSNASGSSEASKSER